MSSNWCPVCLLSSDRELIQLVQSFCDQHGVVNFQRAGALEDTTMRVGALAQILLLDLSQVRSVDDAEKLVFEALQREPRDVVVGIGGGFQGSNVARWARNGMYSLVDCPIRNSELVVAMLEANTRCIRLRTEQSELRLLSMQRRSITKREEEVLELVVQGVPNKSIATRLDVSQRTIESRRQKIYQKMNAKRLTDLIRALDKLEFLSKTML